MIGTSVGTSKDAARSNPVYVRTVTSWTHDARPMMAAPERSRTPSAALQIGYGLRVGDDDDTYSAELIRGAAALIAAKLREITEGLPDSERTEISRNLDSLVSAQGIAPALDGWLAPFRDRPIHQLTWRHFSHGGAFSYGVGVLGPLDLSVATADPDILKPENLSRLAARARRAGINRLSVAQVFVLVLFWLILVGIPLIQPQLPPADQAIINSEARTIGVGLGITAMILQKQKK